MYTELEDFPAHEDPHVTEVTAKSHPNPNTAMTIPATAEEAAGAVAEVSVEGSPGDSKGGPGRLWLWVAAAVVLLLLTSIAFGVLLSPVVGIVAFIWGALAFVINPTIGAAVSRTNDRRKAIRIIEYRHEHPPPSST